MQRDKKQLDESLGEIKEQEEEMSRANRALTLRLEDVQVRATAQLSFECRLNEQLVTFLMCLFFV